MAACKNCSRKRPHPEGVHLRELPPCLYVRLRELRSHTDKKYYVVGYLNIILLISLMGIPFLTFCFFFPDYVSVISTSKGIVFKCLFCIAMCDWLNLF